MAKWVVLSPAGIPAGQESVAAYSAPASGPIRLGFLSNRKPGTAEWQQRIADGLRQEYPDLQVSFYTKSNAAVGMGREVLSRMTQECTLAITGTGD